jgi:hypothetical protein
MGLTSRGIQIAFRCMALALSFSQAWAYRFYIEPDGVNYLDIAGAYGRRDWANAINGYWSPLYSWLLTLMQWMFHPSAYWESTFLHLLNFILFLLALASFEFFFRRLLSLITKFFPEAVDGEGLAGWAWWILGYTAFLICSLRLITLGSDTPDMALAAIVFLATGLLIDLALSNQGAWRTQFVLGLVLGTGYLTKSVMFPLSFVYILTSGVVPNGLKKPDMRALATLGGFLLVSMPFVVVLSHAKGRLTFGDTGKIAYMNQVSGPATETNSSKDAHQPKKLFDQPSVYIYRTPYSATYPAWYDASYWVGDIRPHFVVRNQLREISRAAGGYFRILSAQKEWIAGWLVLAILAGDWRETSKRIVRLWFLWLPSLSALILYGLVLVEPRYVAVPIAILWLTLFAGLPWRINMARKIGAAVIIAIGITSGTALAKDGLLNLAVCVRPTQHVQWQVADGLLRMGLTPGEDVAFLGHTTVADYWAHLAGLKVTADIPLEAMESYWLATPVMRNQVSSALYEEDIRALVTAVPPPIGPNWRPIGVTGYYVEILGLSAASDPVPWQSSH